MKNDWHKKTAQYQAHHTPLAFPGLDEATIAQIKKLQRQFTRAQLEIITTGKISAIFGDKFIEEDNFTYRTRPPAPPLLLIDRVTAIDTEPLSMKPGKMWTEFDVQPDAWFLRDGYVPPNIMLEGGHGFLLLICWLGADLHYLHGERMSRILDSQVTFYGDLAKVGDTLCYEISIDNIANHHGILLMNATISCYIKNELRLKINAARIGFFTDKELQMNKGVLFDINKVKPKSDYQPIPPRTHCQYHHFNKDQLNAFTAGRLAECFGPGFEQALQHKRSPRVSDEKLFSLDKITDFDTAGGPWKRGYIRAVHYVHPDEWFFPYHFKECPCVPGAFSAETAFQLLAFYFSALGFTLDKDNWHFAPAKNINMHYVNRREIRPINKEVIYELFIEQVILQPEPLIIAEALMTVDGIKAGYINQLNVRLVPNAETSRMGIDQVSRKKPLFDRKALEIHASGKISTIFGSLFEQQDQYIKQVRMPEPPLLLADRVTNIEGKAGSMSKGVIWTETDVKENSWYLHDNRMPAGIMIESGQADLMLISWMGIDFFNKGERFYRLLGADITYYGELPKPGETLCYEIHLNSIAKHGDIRLMFFHYTCHINGELRMRMRNGQAGFFTEQELAESGGILWDATTAKYKTNVQLDPPSVICQRTHFTPEQVTAFTQGDTYGCFGPGFELAQTHHYSPRIQAGKLCFIRAVTHFDPKGGPAGRGYMRATQTISPDDWFFKGHFKNDPCMPGTLMGEAGLQVLSFYLAAMGYTLDKDGWRFEPVPGEESLLRCRGQCLPTSKEVVYEIVVEEVIARPYPTVIVDLLGTVDGLKAFHAHHYSVRLVPDWPLTRKPELLKNYQDKKPVAQIDDIKFGYASLLACAYGKPSDAFGKSYKIFDNGKPLPRLPSPPYHFMTRVIEINSQLAAAQVGDTIISEYDVPTEAWYFKENNKTSMPFCVLNEVGLQPCGWLSSFGSHFTGERLHYRNLDGTGTLKAEVVPNAGCLRVHTQLTRKFQLGGMIIHAFNVIIYQDQTEIYTMETSFGFFPTEALAQQVGLPTTDAQRLILTTPCDFNVNLCERPAEFCSGELRLANPMLLMLDRVTGFWPNGGSKQLGQLRAEKEVRPSEWFFKAHFYQDPVQPGSLGLEALIQLLQFYMLEQKLHRNITNPRFEILAIGKPMTWKYRGQVVPTNKMITSTMEITEVSEDERGVYAMAEASLWVDGMRIYETHHLGMRIISATS